MHRIVMTVKSNYLHPGMALEKKKKKKRRADFQESDILEVLSMHMRG